ncbi:MAG: 2Fe-2S iron-sulfur cluster-binding protein [Armatimonadota bacterium]|jgi:NADH dehydrogenase/NADH:ubiquinone oxidoreductase subunit G
MALMINGKQVEAVPGQTVLEAARAAGIGIPTLCYHPAVAPYGACRVCLVEVRARGRTRLVTSCCYPASDGLEVFTNSEKVQKARKGVVELLLARAPESPTLRALATSMGITESRFPSITHGERDCILCGLCVAVCREVMGATAIAFAERGVERVVATPFQEGSDACLGCGACAAVCPMGSIEMRESEAEVEIAPFKSRRPALRCQKCGKPIGAVPFGERIQERLGEKLTLAVTTCSACKRKATAVVVKKTGSAAGAWHHAPSGRGKHV